MMDLDLVTLQLLWRSGCLTVSEAESRLGHLGLSPGRGHCAGPLGNLLSLPLSTQVLMNLMLGVTLQWTSIPSRGDRYTPTGVQ